MHFLPHSPDFYHGHSRLDIGLHIFTSLKHNRSVRLQFKNTVKGTKIADHKGIQSNTKKKNFHKTRKTYTQTIHIHHITRRAHHCYLFQITEHHRSKSRKPGSLVPSLQNEGQGHTNWYKLQSSVMIITMASQPYHCTDTHMRHYMHSHESVLISKTQDLITHDHTM